MKVTNRSDGAVTYELKELHTRRVFSIGETKDISPEELEALFQMDGGMRLIKDYLLVEDKEWVKSHWPDVPVEYFWTADQVKNCLLNDSVELFAETLEYAPEGVIELIKNFAWRLPLTDLNKIKALQDATGFDTLASVDAMKTETVTHEPARRQRLRQEV